MRHIVGLLLFLSVTLGQINDKNFKDSAEIMIQKICALIKKLKKLLVDNDMILVKGSRSMNLDLIINEVKESILDFSNSI